MTIFWEEIGGVQSPGEFVRFASWMEEQLNNGTATKVPVTAPYLGASFDEAWFSHHDSGQVWRLVKPDFPFTGLFEPVEKLTSDEHST